MKYLKYLVSLSMILLVISQIDFDTFGKTLLQLNLYILIFVIVLGFLQLYLNCLSQIQLFQIFFRSHPGLLSQIKHNIVSIAYLMAIPGFAAPDVYLAYYYGKFYKDLPRTLSALMLNRLTGLLIFFFLSIYGVIRYYSTISPLITIKFSWNTIIILIVAFILAGFGVFLLITRYSEKLERFALFIKAVANDIKGGRSFFYKFAMLKFVWYLVSVGGRVVLAKLIGVQMGVSELASIIIIVNFMGSLPISISGLGVREGSYIALMGVFGISAEKALLLSFLDFGITLVWAIPGIFLLIFDKNQVKQNFDERC